MRRLAIALLAAAAALLAAAAPGGAAKKPPMLKCGSPKRVPVVAKKSGKVIDYDILPLKTTVRRDTCFTWKWSADNNDTHDVRLRSGPKGVKKFKSALAANDYSYSYYFKVKGKYRVYCSLHAEMQATVTVR